MEKHTDDAQPELRLLQRCLSRRAFDFMPPGQYKLRPICNAVKRLYPELCNDSVLCTHRTDGHKNPEWEHRVRGSLNWLKRRHRRIYRVDGKWIIKAERPEVATPTRDDAMIDEPLTEGAVRGVLQDKYERNRKARTACVAHHGVGCAVCGMLFRRIYGELAKGLIHVHHLRKLSDIGTEYQIDPIRDLRPVCPNCHAVVHLRNPPFSIEDVKAMRQQASLEPKGNGQRQHL